MLSKERFAWVWVGALVGVLGAYAGVVALQAQGGEPSPLVRIATLAAALSLLGLVALGTWLVGRRRDDTLDERDLTIERRSASAAYNVLMAGMVLVGCVMPFGAGGWHIVHAALFAIAAAEIVHHGLIIVGYRRGWRG